MFFKFSKSIHVLTVLIFIIFSGCTNDESYDNSDFVSEVNTALPNSNTVPFVVVGSSGSIYTSLDGINWNNKSINNESNSFYAVTYGNGIFVALAEHNTIYYSTDTNNWTKTSSGGNGRINDVVYGNGVFVAVSQTGYVARSTDGKLWSNISATGSDTKAITFGNNLFYTHAGDDKSYFSSDGMFWNSQSTSNIGSLKAIIYENGQYILIPESSSNIYTSINGLTYNAILVGGSGNFVSMAFGKGIYVLIGTTNSIWYSSHISSSFTQVSNATSFSNCRKMIYRNNIFIAVGSDTVTENMTSTTVGSIYTSPDGINWTRKFRTSNSSDFNDIY